MSTDAIAPHGGTLINRVASEAEKKALAARAASLPSITLNTRERSDLEMIAVGAFSPLDGFMCQKNYQSVVEKGRLADGLPWTIPITLSIKRADESRYKKGAEVALRGEDGALAGVLEVEEIYPYDKTREAQAVYKTDDLKHPGVEYLMNVQGELLLGGKVTLVERSKIPYPAHHNDPADTRAKFRERGWRKIAAFQTRNPVHRAHEYLTKVALEIADGLLLHPLVGATKDDDIPADVRMRCYEVLLEKYYPAERVLLSTLPAAMRYAGPKEAIFHAIIRKNYGCTHFIVGRDHAGVGNYYGTYDAQKIFDEYTPVEMGITPLMFEHSFFCKLCAAMSTTKTCPHDPSARVVLSGTKVRELLRAGETPPPEFSRPEVAEILIKSMR